MEFPITQDLEKDLIKAGALNASGYIIRPKLRAGFDRIVGNGGRWSLGPIKNAERFILMLHRMSKKEGKSFDEYCEKLGY